MHRFKRILLVAMGQKGAKASLARAEDLAERNQALLTVAAVIEPAPRKLDLVTVIEPDDLKKTLEQEPTEQLERLVAPGKRAGFEVATKVLRGTPFLEIIREVLREHHDLVLVTAEGEVKGMWLGRTAAQLLRKCPCPVWVLGPTPRRRYGRVLAAVDPDPINPAKQALSTKVMELASSLAHADRSELHVVHAWSAFGERALRGQARWAERDVRNYLEEVQEMHEKWLKEFLGRFDFQDSKCHLHLVKNEPGKAITELAEKKHIDVIVMGTVARTGIAGLFVGNTAEKVLNQVHCAVLAVKPDGFVSPVRLDS